MRTEDFSAAYRPPPGHAKNVETARLTHLIYDLLLVSQHYYYDVNRDSISSKISARQGAAPYRPRQSFMVMPIFNTILVVPSRAGHELSITSAVERY